MPCGPPVAPEHSLHRQRGQIDQASVWILVLAFIAALGGFWAGLHFFGRDPTIGNRPPDLSLPDREGRVVQLSQFRGKPVLLNFWASWCGPCIKEMPMLDALAKEHGHAVQVLGITEDDPAAAKAWLEDNPVSYPVLQSPSAQVELSSRFFGNHRQVLPYSVLLDGEGKIVRMREGMFMEGQLEGFVGR